MKILFSPIGGTDPIPQTNCKDGSLLHILRVYKPEKVYLYMSKEILDNQKEDDRYNYCIHKLEEQIGCTFSVEYIERPELVDVHEFDYFYKDFTELLSKLSQNIGAEDELLLNISSGTPAMKSALLVLKTLGEYPYTAIQVATPSKKMNNHDHENYDVEMLWELNEDNVADFENRCTEVGLPSLLKIKQEEMIKRHMKVYDYRAALNVAESLPSKDTEQYIDLLKLAASRLLLDVKTADTIQRKCGVNVFPVRTGNERKYFEYALNLDVKLKKGEYGDFIRATSPLIVDLFEIILKKQFGIIVSDYCSERHGIVVWDEYKLDGTEIKRVLDSFYKEGFRSGGFIKSDNLKYLIVYYAAERGNTQLCDLVTELREVEENVRNMAAHQIVSISDKDIVRYTGFSGKQIMDKLKALFRYTGINATAEAWYSYDAMNELILDRMRD